jgi:mannitol/fructose-specific phosphotransferase system IIA component (Ntr-type)
MISSRLDALLDPRRVVLETRGLEAKDAIWEIVELLAESGELRNPKEFFAAVMEREAKSSTVANGGVAFPHARTLLVDDLLLGVGRSKEGVAFPGGQTPVHLIFVLAVPQQMVNDYLICVGALARRLSAEGTRAALLKATTVAEFLEQLRGE